VNKFHWKNFSWQTVNYAVSGMLLVFLWVLIARVWSVDAFGRFSAIFSLTAVYGLVIELGLDFWVTQQTALGKKGVFSYALIRFRCVSAFCIAVLFCLVGALLRFELIPLMLFIFGAYSLNIAHFFSCYLRGIEKLNLEAILSLIRNVGFVAIACVGLLYGLSLWWIAFSYLFTNVLYGLATVIVIRQHQFEISLKSINLTSILSHSIPIWITGLLFGLTIKLDILLLESFSSAHDLGQFSSAARIYEGGLLVGIAFALTLYPQLSRQVSKSLEQYPKVIFGFSLLLLSMALLATLIGIFIGQPLFIALFGDAYTDASELFFYFICLYPISILVVFLYHSLIVAHKTYWVISILSFGVILNIMFDWWLIPLYGAEGALVTFAIKEALLLGCFVMVLLLRRVWNEKV